MARRIELWPLARLTPYQRNPRTHSEEQVTQIAASIAEFGFCNPILVDSRDGIVAGHGRLLAAKKLELAEVPVIVLDHLDENQRRAYLLADNRLSELAGWDHELLALELKELADAGFDATLAGFDQKEIDDFLASLERDAEPESNDAEDSVPEVPTEAVTRPGDLLLERLFQFLVRHERPPKMRNAALTISASPQSTRLMYDAKTAISTMTTTVETAASRGRSQLTFFSSTKDSATNRRTEPVQSPIVPMHVAPVSPRETTRACPDLNRESRFWRPVVCH